MEKGSSFIFSPEGAADIFGRAAAIQFLMEIVIANQLNGMDDDQSEHTIDRIRVLAGRFSGSVQPQSEI